VTLGVVGQVVRPLHELEEIWRAGQRRPMSVGWIVVEPCLCGDVIRARNKPHAIEAAVLAHNESTRHTHWAIRNGWRHG
jgi:hypothetical protein